MQWADFFFTEDRYFGQNSVMKNTIRVYIRLYRPFGILHSYIYYCKKLKIYK